MPFIQIEADQTEPGTEGKAYSRINNGSQRNTWR